jgi:23S rRNA (pseudouridine1915-N3)-methyltransferase
MPLRILAVGKKHEPWVSAGIGRYETRLKKPFIIEWVLLPHSARDGLSARQDESERLLSRVHADDFVVLLDERGRAIDSPALARLLLDPIESAKNIVFIIGGAYGVDASVHARANFAWSLSPLVFPHQLVRLILIEQLYRAQEIIAGGPYHHE